MGTAKTFPTRTLSSALTSVVLRQHQLHLPLRLLRHPQAPARAHRQMNLPMIASSASEMGVRIWSHQAAMTAQLASKHIRDRARSPACLSHSKKPWIGIVPIRLPWCKTLRVSAGCLMRSVFLRAPWLSDGDVRFLQGVGAV